MCRQRMLMSDAMGEMQHQLEELKQGRSEENRNRFNQRLGKLNEISAQRKQMSLLEAQKAYGCSFSIASGYVRSFIRASCNVGLSIAKLQEEKEALEGDIGDLYRVVCLQCFISLSSTSQLISM